MGEEPADAPPKDEIVGDLGALADGEPVNEAAVVQAAAQAPTPAAPEPEPARPPPPAAEPPDPAPTAAAATPQHSALLDLPADHYAVQLLAMTDARQLQQFVDQHGLASARTARVERSGELYYVLLLGVYDSLEGARQASLNLPAPLATNEPWIRPLGSLQNAIVRGNALAMATD